jgi:hypothetical protein
MCGRGVSTFSRSRWLSTTTCRESNATQRSFLSAWAVPPVSPQQWFHIDIPPQVVP